MDSANEPRPGDGAFDGFRMRLPDDCVEYMLFLMNGEKGLSSLEGIRKASMKLVDELTAGYIWQRDAFELETKVQNGKFMSLLSSHTVVRVSHP